MTRRSATLRWQPLSRFDRDTDPTCRLIPPGRVRWSAGELTALLLSDDPLDALLVRIGELAGKDLPCVKSCGITATVDGRRTTVVATDERARAVDQLQYDAHTGPCLEALSTGETVTIGDCRTDPRYADFPEQAAANGVLCVLALPLNVGG